MSSQSKFDHQFIPGSVKIAMKEAGAGSSDLWKVPYEQLHVIPNFNARVRNAEYIAHVRSLADSMKAIGFKQDKPLSGYVAIEGGKQTIYITDGHSRYEAAGIAISEGAEIVRIPIVIAQSGASIEDLTAALVTSNNGRPLSPFETGVVCKRLIGFGFEVGEIAARLSLSEQYVNNLLSLMAAPIEIRQMVMRDEVSASVAIEVVGKHGEKALEVLTAAQERATSSGKGKVTAKHIDPANEFKKTCKARAAEMFALLEQVASAEDEADRAQCATLILPGDTHYQIQALVQELKGK